jgi:hypothetical protein
MPWLRCCFMVSTEDIELPAGVGEERISAHAHEQPGRAGLDRPGFSGEPDPDALAQHVAASTGLAGLGAGSAIHNKIALRHARSHPQRPLVRTRAAVALSASAVPGQLCPRRLGRPLPGGH